MKTLTKTLTILLLMLLAVSCSKDEGFLSGGDELSDVLKGKQVIETSVPLTGTTHFASFAIKENRVVSPHDMNMLRCEAILTPMGGQMYMLETEEYFGPMLFRRVSFEVKLTPGGSLKFCWPAAWEELNFATGELEANTMDLIPQIYLHTGCEITGPGVNKGTINYKGYFDGETFYANAHFMGKQKVPGLIAPFYDQEPVIDGPIQFDFSIELEL